MAQPAIHPVQPANVEFDNALDRLVYVQTISIRNYSDKARRVRIEGPAARGPFSLVFSPGPSLAPGLELTADVQFVLPDAESVAARADDNDTGVVYRDRLIVHFGNGDQKVEVPLRAVTPQARILAVPTAPRGSATRLSANGHECVVAALDAPGTYAVRLGDVVVGTTTTCEIELRNHGPVAGDWALDFEAGAENELHCSPAHGQLGADPREARVLSRLGAKRLSSEDPLEHDDGSRDDESGTPRVDTSQYVTLKVTASKLGAARFRVRVKSPQLTPCVLDVSAVVVTQQLELYCVSGGRRNARLANVDFGSMFYGQSRERQAMLVNNSPQPVPFVISLHPDRDLANEAAREADARRRSAGPGGGASPRAATADGAKFLDEWEADDGSLTVTPLEGLLEPHARQPVTFRFAPPKPPLTTAFKHQLHAPMQPTDDDAEPGETGGRQRRNVPSRPYGLKVRVGVPVAGGGVAEPKEGEAVATSKAARPEMAALEVAVTAHAAPTTAVHVSPKTLRFGTCEPRQKQKGLVTIENASDVAAKFEFAKVAQFSVTPAKGKIAGRAKAAVMVTFNPAQIGNFDVRCDLKVEGGLSSQTLRMLGRAVKATTYPAAGRMVIDATGSVDVSAQQAAIANMLSAEPSTWQDGDAALLAGIAEKRGRKFDYWEERDNQIRAEKQRSDMNKTQYVKYLRERRGVRETIAAKKEEAARVAYARRNPSDPTGAELAMEPLEEPPLPPLPDAYAEPLWMNKGGRAAASSGGGKPAFDADRLVAEKFKPRPTTQAEMRHCSTRLSAADLARISSSHATLDFGRVCVGSKAVKNFAVSNGLAHAVLVAISAASLPPELAQGTTPASQVVPGEATAGFDIALHCSRETLGYRCVVQYTINDRHTLKLAITADVVPVELVLSSPELNIEFDPHSLEPSVDATISLSNPGNSAVEFFWTHAPPFSVLPEQGVVPPFGSTAVAVTWTPSPVLKNVGKLHVHVPGAKEDLELSVAGRLDDAKCAFSERKLDFATVSVGMERDLAATVQNTGACSAVCTVEVPAEVADFLFVSHQRFRLVPGGAQHLTVSLKPRAPRTLDGTTLLVHVRGAKTIRLPVTGSAIIPDVKIVSAAPRRSDSDPLADPDDGDAPCFDFADQFVGFEERRRIVLRNESEIGAFLTLDLNAFPDFYAEPCKPSDTLARPAEAKGDAAAKSVTGEAKAKSAAKGLEGDDEPADPRREESSSGSTMELVQTEIRDGTQKKGQPVPIVEHWALHVAPRGALALELVFAPKAPGTHEFDLPLELSELQKRPWGHVRAAALRPMLVLSSTSVDFGERIFASDATRQVPFSSDVILSNHHHGTLQWALDETAGTNAHADAKGGAPRSAVFFVSPKEGKLVPGESTTVRVTFVPTSSKEYEERFPLSFFTEQEAAARTAGVADDGAEKKAKPYLTLLLKGAGAHPRLEVEDGADDGYVRGPGDVFTMPTVPTGVTSRVLLYVRNRGFEHIQLNYRLPPHVPVKLNVEFPEGRALGVAAPRLAVVISFVSDAPVSFTTALQLLDSDGNAYTVPIAGAADNCLLSTHAFLASYQRDYAFHVRDGQAPRLVEAALARQLMEDEMREKEQQRMARRRGSSAALSKADKKAESAPPTPAPKDEAPKLSGVDPKRDRPLPSEDIAPLLVLWLNYHALNGHKGVDAPLKCIPDDCVSTHGRVAIDAIEALAGRKVPGRLQRVVSNDKELVQHLMSQYAALLLFLVERGALLNTVRPEQLLSKHHYVKMREQQADFVSTRAARDARHAKWDESHAATSLDAWLSVLLQAIRIFSLARITPKTFASLPGVLIPKPPRAAPGEDAHPHGSADPELAGSNVYSVGECVVLKWLGYHAALGAGNGAGLSKRFHTFAAPFSDGTGLCAVLASNAPTLCETGGALNGFKTIGDARSHEDKAQAMDKAVKALDKLRCDLGGYGDDDETRALTTEDLLGLRDVRALLVALHLYLTLPNFVPKTTIEFNATLGAPMCKMIELRNSAPREITYEVVLEGSRDFKTTEDRDGGDKDKPSFLLVESKGSAAYTVELVPRFSKAVEGRLTFYALPGSCPGLRPPSMVFTLRSNVESHAPVAVIEHESTAYEPKTIDVTVKSPFVSAGTFEVALKNATLEDYTPPRKPAGNGQRGRGRAAAQQQAPAKKKKRRAEEPTHEWLTPGRDPAYETAINLLKEPFWTSQKSLRLDASGATSLSLQLLTCSPGLYKAELTFLNADIGEFVVEVVARVHMPKQMDAFKLSIEAEDDGQIAITKLMRLPPTNPLLERAFNALGERLPSGERSAARAALQAVSRGPPTAVVDKATAKADAAAAHKAHKEAEKAGVSVDDEEADAGTPFEVTTDSPFFQCPDDLLVAYEVKDGDKKAAKGSAKKTELVDVTETTVIDAPNSMVLSFYPQKAGTYLCAVVSQARPGLVHDIRILNVEIVVTMPRVQTVLEFKAPARRKITQELPLLNASEEEWTLSCQISGARVFTGPQKLKVPAGGRGSYPLTFAPNWTGMENAKLVLRNARSPEAFEYTLQGEGEPPLAEGHEVLRCNARETTTHAFKLENTSSKPLSYKVESDLPFVSGAASIDVPANSSASYDLKISPSLGGQYTGSVTFTPPTGEYVWYTVKVEVGSPLEESAIEISTVVRQAASARISLTNPLPEAIDFDVILQGDGLLGEPRFTLEASEQAGTYELFYTPLIAQSHAGSVVFLNDRVGEFWYRLNLSAAPAEPTRLDALECAVGARTSTTVCVENPLNREITLATSVANRSNFLVEPSITIGPYGSEDVEIQYVPSEIGIEQDSTVVLRHDVLGDWEYVATGRGTPPGTMNEHTPSAIVGEPASYMFGFRNPFGVPLDVDIELESTDDHDGALSLLMRRTDGVRLAPHVSMSIPLSFDPVVIAEHHGTVRVSGDYRGSPLVWTFPIRGIVNAPLQLRAVRIHAMAKTSTRHEVRLALSALAELAPGGEDFSYELVAPDQAMKAVVDRSLEIRPVNTRLLAVDGELTFEAIFEPLRPFSTSVHLVVKRATGGRWPFEVQLDVEEPEPDDTIEIEANLHTTAKVTFKLTNANSVDYAPFSAFFSTDSAHTLTVSPSHGLLAPVGSAGTQFDVSFAPVKYGMLQRGRLIIQTEDMMWSYEVHGTHPTFTVPVTASKVDTHMSKKYLRPPKNN